MATLNSAIDPNSPVFRANADIYGGLLKTLHTRQAWSLAANTTRISTCAFRSERLFSH